MSSTSVRRLGVAVVLVSGLLLAGCGVSAQDRPIRIDPDEVPFGLVRDPAEDSATTTTSPAAPATPPGSIPGATAP